MKCVAVGLATVAVIVLAMWALVGCNGTPNGGQGGASNPYGIPDGLLQLVVGAAEGVSVGEGFTSPTATRPEIHEGAMMLAQVGIAASPELTAFANSAAGQRVAQKLGCAWRCPVMKAVILSGGGVIHYYNPPGQVIDPNGEDRYLRMFWTTWQGQEFGEPAEPEPESTALTDLFTPEEILELVEQGVVTPAA